MDVGHFSSSDAVREDASRSVADAECLQFETMICSLTLDTYFMSLDTYALNWIYLLFDYLGKLNWALPLIVYHALSYQIEVKDWFQ